MGRMDQSTAGNSNKGWDRRGRQEGHGWDGHQRPATVTRDEGMGLEGTERQSTTMHGRGTDDRMHGTGTSKGCMDDGMHRIHGMDGQGPEMGWMIGSCGKRLGF